MEDGLKKALEITDEVDRAYDGQGPDGDAEETSFAKGLRLGWKNACAEIEANIEAALNQ